MAVKISGAFVGGLLMEMTHEPSAVKLKTDPPSDNGGDASSYSPTDLVATGLGACMMSVMAIAAKKKGWDLSGMSCEVEKHMSLDLPRRIVQLDVHIKLPGRLKPDMIDQLKQVANDCPVIHSLHQGIAVNKNYEILQSV